MGLTTTAAALVLLVVVGALTAADLRPDAVHAFGRRAGLPAAPDEADGWAGERVRRRARVGTAGAVVGGVSAGVALVLARITAGDVAMTLVWAAVAALVARAAAVAGLALLGALRAPAPGPRVTRAIRTGTADYVAVSERAVAVVAGVLPAVLLVAYWVTTTAPDGWALAWPAIVALVALAVAGLVARRIVARPQPAAARLDLAWDDALRARTLRDLVAGAALVGAGYGLLSVAVMGVAPGPGVVATVADVVFVALAALAVAATALPGPGARVRRRLWATGYPATAVPAASS